MTTSPKCVGALLVRNEADRYLARVLANVARFTDEIVVVDDQSEDASATLARDMGALVESSTKPGGWWGSDESHARAQLWDLAARHAGPEGWIYVADADHELLGITPPEFRRLLRTTAVNAWAFPLWDCWDSDTQHRIDGYWQAWRTPRPWLFRALPQPGFTPSWGTRGIHAGHLPHNYPVVAGLVPGGCGVRHLSYVRPEDRARKAAKYLAVA